MYEAGCSGLVHWDDSGRWDGEGGERRVLDGEYMNTCMPVADSCRFLAKTTTIL